MAETNSRFFASLPTSAFLRAGGSSRPPRKSHLPMAPDSPVSSLASFQKKVWKEGVRLYRDLPWRRTTDPYRVFLSEVMLQQTQVSRVQKYWNAWLDRFPVIDALAEAPLSEILSAWQGMGYNRRAIALQKAAQQIMREYDGIVPRTIEELVELPGVGPATAAGLLAFAFNKPAIYLETNVRAVFIHELFPGAINIPDKQLVPLIEKTCPGYGSMSSFKKPCSQQTNLEKWGPRNWYYALLDYGAFLKKMFPNPSRRSKTATKQSTFEGSRRQKRAELIRLLLEDKEFAAQENGLTTDALAQMLSNREQEKGRAAVDATLTQSILEDLQGEGFCNLQNDYWIIAP